MGHSNNQPPFKRGQTLFNKPVSNTSLATTDGAEVEGQIWEFPDADPSTGAVRSNKTVTCMAVRWTGDADNSDGNGVVTPIPKRCIVLDSHRASNYSSGVTSVAGAIGLARSNQMARLGSATSVLPSKCYPVDEYLPTTGVATNDIFWVVLDGPATVLTADAQFTAIAVGDALVALTQTTAVVTNGSTISGRVVAVDIENTTATCAGLPARIIGTALSACTSQGYSQNVLVDVGGWKS